MLVIAKVQLKDFIGIMSAQKKDLQFGIDHG